MRVAASLIALFTPCGNQLAVSIRYSNVDDQEVLLYDRVIACTGFRFDNSIFVENCRPELVYNGRLPAQTSDWESPLLKTSTLSH